MGENGEPGPPHGPRIYHGAPHERPPAGRARGTRGGSLIIPPCQSRRSRVSAGG
jgi:hypothetical protein